MKTALEYITKIPPEATTDQEITDALGACLRAENIPYAFAQRDEAGNCLTCGRCGLCPGIHTFEEIIDASERGIPPPLTGWTAAQLPKTPRYARSRIFAAALEMFEALQATILPLERLGDFVGNVDKGGASGLGEIDRCAILYKVRAAIALAKGEYESPTYSFARGLTFADYTREAKSRGLIVSRLYWRYWNDKEETHVN
jgi:hypothetical protein